jgi:hypothetical protein
MPSAELNGGDKPVRITGVVVWSPLNTSPVVAGSVSPHRVKRAFRGLMASWKADRHFVAAGNPRRVTDLPVARPREHRSRRSQRSSARGDPSPSEPEPPLEVVPLARFWRDVRRWKGAAA